MTRSSIACALPLLALTLAGCGDSAPEIAPWSKHFGDAEGTARAALAVDPSGKVAVAGSFRGTIDLGGGQLQSTALEYYDSDAFMGVLDAGGQHVWSASTGDESEQSANAISFDPTGNVFVTGNFFGTMIMGDTALSSTSQAVFFAKLDSKGAPLFVKQFSTGADPYQYNDASANAVAVSADGAVAVGGTFSQSLQIDADTLQAEVDYSTASFIAKFDNEGHRLFSRALGGTSHQVLAMTFDDAGDLLVAGTNSGTLKLGGEFQAEYTQNGWVAKLDASGDPIWAFQLGGPSSLVSAIQIDPSSGDILVGGTFRAKMGAGDFVAKVDTYYQTNGFALAVSPDGAPRWLKTWELLDNVRITAVDSGIVVAAQSPDGISITLLNTDGEELSSQALKSSLPAMPISLVASGEDVILSGDFGTDIRIGDKKLTSSGYNQLFVARLTP